MDSAISIPCDTLVYGWIYPYGDMDAYPFEGSAGERVIIRMKEISGPLSPMLELFGPWDTLLVSDYSSSHARIEDYALPSSRPYTI